MAVLVEGLFPNAASKAFIRRISACISVASFTAPLLVFTVPLIVDNVVIYELPRINITIPGMSAVTVAARKRRRKIERLVRNFKNFSICALPFRPHAQWYLCASWQRC